MVLGIIGIALGIVFRGQNIGFLSGLTGAIAASAIFPSLVLAIYWRKFTQAGAIAGILTGLLSTLLLLYLSPTMQVDILHNAAPIITLRNPGIITVPLAFIVSIVVSLATYGAADSRRHDAVERQLLLGLDRA